MTTRNGWRLRFGAGVALLLTAACGPASDDLSDFGELGGGDAPAHDGEGGAEPADDEDGGFDGDPGSTSEQTEGCAKVDFLFVVDNSISMQAQQAALIASFPGFMASIEATLTADDYHIMVVDTDAKTRCTKSNCNTGAMNAQELCSNPANGYACKQDKFTYCDKQLGAGVVHPAGKAATNAPCAIHGGNRYIIQGEPNLAGTFECTARVGLAGDPAERPMDAMVAALSPTMNLGGCNNGFLRDDAILVITFISNDPWYEDSGTPQDWYNAVVAAKNGNPQAVVVVGLTPNVPGCLDGKGPPKGAHWSQFISLWGASGLEGSVCSSDYVGIFNQALSAIDNTCDNFVPPPR